MAPPGSTLAPAARTSPAPHPTPSPSPSLHLSPSPPLPQVAPGGGPGLSHARGGCARARGPGRPSKRTYRRTYIKPYKAIVPYPQNLNGTPPPIVCRHVGSHARPSHQTGLLGAPRDAPDVTYTKTKINPKIKTLKRNLNRRSVRRGRSPHTPLRVESMLWFRSDDVGARLIPGVPIRPPSRNRRCRRLFGFRWPGAPMGMGGAPASVVGRGR